MFAADFTNADANDTSVEASLRLHPKIEQAHESVRIMTGSAKNLALYREVIDIASRQKVAGKYINKMIMASLDAHDLVEVAEHEAFLFAEDVMMEEHERAMIRRVFAPGSEMAIRVQTALTQRGMYSLASQCHDPVEIAANAFTLWRSGAISVQEPQAQGLFKDIVEAFKMCTRWLRQVVLDQQIQTPEQLFTALEEGDLAERQAVEQQQRQSITGYSGR